MRLTDCFMDVIGYVAYFVKSVSKRQPAFDQVKGDIRRLISASEDSLKNSTFSQADYDMARFAVCAWVDEAIMDSAWEQKNQWQREQLQREYYQTADAGEKFFERLNTIGAHQNDVREVFYLCLSLGFTGRYCNEGDDYLLDQLKTSNLKLLTGSSVGLPSLEREELFPDAYPADVGDAEPLTKSSGFTLMTMISGGGPVVLFCVLYIIYYFVLSNFGNNILGQ
jgi:type VI secretion system protein ImpK